jgi:two-component system nitrogen regulation response regulator GlnG
MTPTALVVDDDPFVQEVLARWLAESGRTAMACRTYEEAKEYLAGHTPDVLVADIRLQGHNGLQLVMLLMEKQPAALCVVVTGHDDPVLRKEAEQLNARYLLKPFERSTFLAAIERGTHQLATGT